jgi:hypothetical protein
MHYPAKPPFGAAFSLEIAMCQFQNLRPSIDAGPTPPPPAEGARALYPTLDMSEPRPVSLPPVVPLQWSDIGAAPEQPLSPLAPSAAGQRPKVVEANPARVFIEIAKRTGGLLRREEPTPVPPPPLPAPETGRKRDASPFTPTDPREVPPIPAPSPAPSPEPPRLPPTPGKLPELPKNEAFVPPDLKGILKPIAGGDFTIPPGGPITFPGKVPDNVPGILVLAIEMLHGEQKGGVIGKVGHVEEADLAAADPMYGRFKKLAERAAEIVGPGKGPERGKRVHKEVERLIEADFSEAERKNIRVEYTAGEEKGDETHYGQKGRPRVDIHHDVGNGEARIYELKTGSAREKEERIYRLFKDTFFGKIERATVTEIWVP